MKRIRVMGLALVAAVIAGVASAELPHTFQNGTVADANQVNANFQALDQRLGSVESALGGSSTQQTHHPYTRNPVATNIGDLITLNGVQFVIVGHPFVDYQDNSRHILKFPVETCEGSSPLCAGGIKNNALRTSHVFASPQAHFTIDGYPASLLSTDGRNYTALPVRNPDTGEYQMHYQVTEAASAQLSLRVGTTNINLNMPFFLFDIDRQPAAPLLTEDADYTDEIDWAAVTGHAIDFDAMYKFFDYIAVINVPSP